MLLKRLLLDTLQWLLANALVLFAVKDMSAFLSDRKGATLLIVLNILWLVPVVGNLYVPREKIRASAKEYCYYLWMAVLLVEVIACAYEYTHFRFEGKITSYEVVSGLTLICLGFLVSLVGWLSIRRYSAPEFQIIEGHKVIDEGLYRYIRHPIYTGFFLIASGLPLFLRSISGLLALILIVTPAWMYVIGQEEKFLVSELGDDYVAYMGKTKRLIPFVY